MIRQTVKFFFKRLVWRFWCPFWIAKKQSEHFGFPIWRIIPKDKRTPNLFLWMRIEMLEFETEKAAESWALRYIGVGGQIK